jgi:hypothetical protein
VTSRETWRFAARAPGTLPRGRRASAAEGPGTGCGRAQIPAAEMAGPWPSDLRQMPNLLNFLIGQAAVLGA